jgi:hypothetical protein
MTTPFEKAYPNIAHWVKTHGWIEIGQDDYSKSFVKALDLVITHMSHLLQEMDAAWRKPVWQP